MVEGDFSRRTMLKGLVVGGLSMAFIPLVSCRAGTDLNAPPADTKIVRAAIHPAVGVAHAGNSLTDYYIAPEVPGIPATAENGFKDATGALKRKAARFRIFGLNQAGEVVRELTASDADIEWNVHLANKKAAWYQCDTPLDIEPAKPAPKRNPTVKDRASLVIDGGHQQIHGVSKSSNSFVGNFGTQQIYLGELRTDDVGRLVVLGGRGHAYSPGNAPILSIDPPNDNARPSLNQNGWADDTSDGPVTARVVLNGTDLPVDSSWVVVSQPMFSPSMVAPYVSVYDVVQQTMLDKGLLQHGETSFRADILPRLARLSDMQWVNAGALRDFGWGSSSDFSSPELIRKLSDSSDQNLQTRTALFERFRNPSYEYFEPDSLPPMLGDDTEWPSESTHQWLAVTTEQYRHLGNWAKGDFADDFDAVSVEPATIEDIPLQQRPAALDRAHLETMSGGAFHPGIEVSWTVRQQSMYDGLYRIKHLPSTELDYGPELTPAVALSAEGPTQGAAAGDLSKWMALPWHADALRCASGYQQFIDPYLWTFWPTRAPDHVLRESDYHTIMDPNAEMADRVKAFQTRASWKRSVMTQSQAAAVNAMISDWPKLGVLVDKPGPGDPNFPDTLKVETETGFPEPQYVTPVSVWYPQHVS